MAWRKVCTIASVPENSLVRFDVEGVPIVIARHEGEFFAYPPLCPHMAEPLAESGVCADGVLTCTKHLWQWDMRSGAEQGDAERPLLLYPTRCEGDELFVEIEQELSYAYD
jgi:nitrite reductase/ring-hydroxylating ferredoxin subunit